jgi:hypothetical protein
MAENYGQPRNTSAVLSICAHRAGVFVFLAVMRWGWTPILEPARRNDLIDVWSTEG